MVERLIELSARHKWIVFGIVLLLTAWAADSVRKTPLDALPDISDPQEVIARAKALSAELGTPITPGFEALVFKASRGIEDIY